MTCGECKFFDPEDKTCDGDYFNGYDTIESNEACEDFEPLTDCKQTT